MTWSARQEAILRELGLGAVLPPRRVARQTRTPRADGLPDAVSAAVATAMLAAEDATSGAGVADPTRQATSPPAPRTARERASTPRPAPVPDAVTATARASHPASQPTAAVSARSDAARIALLDWADLQAEVQACEACALSKTRRQTVFGVGLQRAHWMIVGEAPGESEDKLGEPFVGAAGQLLDRMLAALGLTRQAQDASGEPTPPEQAVYIANTLKCRPPGNRNPSAQELATCEPFLQRQIALVQPRVILAMGRFAVGRLLQSDAPIGTLRGQIHRVGGVPVVVTYHPAYLLRNPVDKARAWEDLCLAAHAVQAPVGTQAS